MPVNSSKAHQNSGMAQSQPQHYLALLWAAILCWCAAPSHAAEVGHIIFATDDTRLEAKAIAVGQIVQEGEVLSTGDAGYLYLKTIDKGFLILRPGTTARVVSYRVDPAQPNNSRFKIELLDGAARYISGQAVKASRQNFRFNTPVGAIGVRGTDFTVYTTPTLARISVNAGAIVAAGFSSACTPEGSGPCEGRYSQELYAHQTGQVLQLKQGQAMPELLRGSSAAPDPAAPARPDEPTGKGANPIDTSVAKLDSANPRPPAAPLAPPQVLWGRWQAVLDQQAELNLATLQKSHNIVAMAGNYVVLRERAFVWQAPAPSTIGFSLAQHQATLQDERSGTYVAASLQHAQLQVDFAKSTFTTQFDVVSQGERFARQAQGFVSPDGQLAGNSQFMPPTNMIVNGALNSVPSLSASYVFQTRIDEHRLATGVTQWGK